MGCGSSVDTGNAGKDQRLFESRNVPPNGSSYSQTKSAEARSYKNNIQDDWEKPVTESEKAALEEEFAKYLMVKREKAGQMYDDVKNSNWMEKGKNMSMNIGRAMMQQIENMKAIKNLRPSEMTALKQFMAKVETDRKNQPPPKRRPEGLELGLIGISLFSGNEIVSKMIRYVTKSSWSHVALLLYDVRRDPTDPDGWYTYSANGSAGQIIHDHQLPQVQLEKWTTVAPTYDGAAATRLIIHYQGASPPSHVITDLVDKYLGMPYERQVMIMIRTMRRANVENPESATSAFCSEICYRILCQIEVLEETEVAENVWPKDFTSESDRLKLRNANWGRICVVKGAPPPA